MSEGFGDVSCTVGLSTAPSLAALCLIGPWTYSSRAQRGSPGINMAMQVLHWLADTAKRGENKRKETRSQKKSTGRIGCAAKSRQKNEHNTRSASVLPAAGKGMATERKEKPCGDWGPAFAEPSSHARPPGGR